MYIYRLFTFFLIQFSLVGLLSLQIANGSASEQTASSGCGSGAGSCGATQLGTDGASSDESGSSQGGSIVEDGQQIELDTGYPIDIPVPIAKGIDGIDPSTLVFSESIISQLKSSHHLLAVSPPSDNTVGIISGRLKNSSPCEIDVNYAMILDGEFVFEDRTENCEIRIPVDSDWVGNALPIVVVSEDREQVSHPVITKVSPAPNDPLFAGKNYILEIQITNTSDETIDDTQASIQDQEIEFLEDGRVIFQSLNNDLFPFLSVISPYGGANEAITFSDDIDGFLDNLLVSSEDVILGYNLDRNKIFEVQIGGPIIPLKSVEPALDYDVYQSIHPSHQYFVARELLSDVEHINVYDFQDPLTTILSYPISSHTCENGEIISLNWHDLNKVGVFKKCNDINYEFDVYDISEAFENLNSPQAYLIHRMRADYYIGKAVSDWGSKNKFFYECRIENTIKVCQNSVSFPSIEEEQVLPIEVGSSDITRLSLSQDRRSYLVFEVDNNNDDISDNIVGYYDLNNETTHFTGRGFRPLASPIDNDLVACLGYDDLGNIQIGLLNIPYEESMANPLEILSNVNMGLNQNLFLKVEGGVPPYEYEILSGLGELNSVTGLFYSSSEVGETKIKVTDSIDQEKIITISQREGGTFDSSFSNNGTLRLDSISEENTIGGMVMEVYPDGRILIGGMIDASSYGKDYFMAVGRYMPDGSLDSSFGEDGLRFINTNQLNSRANSLAIDHQGRIILVGHIGDGVDLDLVAVRLLPNGEIDSSFADEGLLVLDIDGAAVAETVRVLNDSSIIISGKAIIPEGNRMLIIKLDDNGSYDTSFQNDGIHIFSVGATGSSIKDMEITSDGSILLAGFALNGLNQFDFALTKLDSNGEFYEYFGNNGVVITDIAGSPDKVMAIDVKDNSRIVAVGDYFHNPKLKMAVYLTNGSLDESFSEDGLLETTFGYDSAGAEDVKIQSDGKILVAGYIIDNEVRSDILVRYLSNGEVDSSFGEDGMLIFENKSQTRSSLAVDLFNNIYMNHSTLSVHKLVP